MKALIMDEERHLIVKDMPKPQEKDENIIIKVEAQKDEPQRYLSAEQI